jgi:DNA replicative helicase MCM subunit Mcm2 (Cdc46/Mcm family)
MKIKLRSVQEKIKNFLRIYFKYRVFLIFKNKKINNFKIFLEDISLFDRELYLVLLKKPQKIITLFEFSIRYLIKKINKPYFHEFNFEDFQIILLRRFFNSVPKKASEIIEDQLISLKIIVLSIGPLRLKNKKNMKFFGKKNNKNKSTFFNQNQLYELKNLEALEPKQTKESLIFIDYQTIRAKGFFGLDLAENENLDLILVLEKNFVGKFTPGDEVFISGIVIFYNPIHGNSKKYGYTKMGNKNYLIKVLGFSKIFTPSYFQTPNLFDNLDKKFINFARSGNIYKWIYSLVVPEIEDFLDIKQSLSCLLFGGNEKILKNDYAFKGQINILMLGKEIEIFSTIKNYLRTLKMVSYKKNKILKNIKNKTIIDLEINKISFSEINRISSNFGIFLVEKLENLNFNEQIKLADILETKLFLTQENLFINESNIISTIAFFENDFKKNLYKTKYFVTESNILKENLKKFDLVFISSRLSNNLFSKKKYDSEKSYSPQFDKNFDPNSKKLNDPALEFLINYIVFTRKKFKPVLSKKATEFMRNAYIFLKISKKENIISNQSLIKQLESIIKISEATAKMRMANEINSFDVLQAIRLVNKYII